MIVAGDGYGAKNQSTDSVAYTGARVIDIAKVRQTCQCHFYNRLFTPRWNHTLFQAMSELMVKLVWDDITVIYSDDLYGRKMLDTLEQELSAHYICVERAEAMSSHDRSIPDISTDGAVFVGTQGLGEWRSESNCILQSILITYILTMIELVNWQVEKV